MAGSEEQNPAMSTTQLVNLIRQAGRVAVERDTLYKELKVFSDTETEEPTITSSLN